MEGLLDDSLRQFKSGIKMSGGVVHTAQIYGKDANKPKSLKGARLERLNQPMNPCRCRGLPPCALCAVRTRSPPSVRLLPHLRRR